MQRSHLIFNKLYTFLYCNIYFYTLWFKSIFCIYIIYKYGWYIIFIIILHCILVYSFIQQNILYKKNNKQKKP